MRVLVTGATGFTGSWVVPLLIPKVQVRCLIRPGSEDKKGERNGVEWVWGDLSDEDSLARAMEGMDCLVNIASLGFGHAPGLVRAALRAGVKRAIFISTTAIFTALNVPSKAVRLAAEEVIEKSGLDYTILRPTMIYGDSRDRNMCRLIHYLRRWPVLPIPGSGEHRFQPVYVEDVARAVVSCLYVDQTRKKSYNLPGGNALTFREAVNTICRQLGRKVRPLSFPASPLIFFLSFLEKINFRLPLRAEQVRRLNEPKVFDFTEAGRDFGYQSRSFEEGIFRELREMGLAGGGRRISPKESYWESVIP